jgi:membrane protein
VTDGQTPTKPKVSAYATSLLDRLGTRAERRFPRLDRVLIGPGLTIVPRVTDDRIGVEAGSITYGAFLALPPLLLLLVAATGLLFSNNAQAQRQLLDVIEGLVPGLKELLSNQLKIPASGQLSLGVIGAIGLVWTASGLAARIRVALGVVFRTPPTGLVFGRFSAAVVGVPVFVVIVGLVALNGFASSLHLSGILGVTSDVLIYAGQLLASLAFFWIVYWLLTPGRVVSLRSHLPGAIAFTVAWVALEAVGALYVSKVIARSTALYGVIGAIFGLLAFIYATMWAFLLAGEFTQATRERRSG